MAAVLGVWSASGLDSDGGFGLLPGADPYVTFQHPGVKLLYFLSGEVRYRYGGKVVEVREGDSLLFEATALHGIEAIRVQPVSYLSVVFTLRE